MLKKTDFMPQVNLIPIEQGEKQRSRATGHHCLVEVPPNGTIRNESQPLERIFFTEVTAFLGAPQTSNS